MKIFITTTSMHAQHVPPVSISSRSLVTTYYYGDSLPGIVNIILLSYLSDSLPPQPFRSPTIP